MREHFHWPFGRRGIESDESSGGVAVAQTSEQDTAERALTPQEKLLESREVSRDQKLGGGANESRIVELKDDGSVIFKSRGGERKELRRGIEAGTYYLRERAAYLVSEFLDLHLVPTTVIREVNGQVGSAQEFIHDTQPGNVIFDSENLHIQQEERRLEAFDFVIWNSDRHTGNFLVKDGTIVAIDHGLSFSRSSPTFWRSKLKGDLPEDVQQKLDAFVADPIRNRLLRDLLGELVGQEEAGACLARIRWLAQQRKKFNGKSLGLAENYYPGKPLPNG